MEGTHGIPAVDVIILCVHISTKSLAAYLRLTLRQRAILPPSVKMYSDSRVRLARRSLRMP